MSIRSVFGACGGGQRTLRQCIGAAPMHCLDIIIANFYEKCKRFLVKLKKFLNSVNEGFTNRRFCGIIQKSSGNRFDIGVSPSGKAADSDSVISRVQILPPQPFYDNEASREPSFAARFVFLKRMYRKSIIRVLAKPTGCIISSPPCASGSLLSHPSVMPTDSPSCTLIARYLVLSPI